MLAMIFPVIPAAAQVDTSAYVPNEIIIKFVDPSTVPGQEKQLQHEIDKLEKIGFVKALGVYVLKTDDLSKNPEAVINRFKNNKFVEYVEPNYIAQFTLTPNDTYYVNYQSFYDNLINAPAGWDITTGEGGPIIAVVDSGVAAHPDLPALLPGYAAVDGLSPNSDTVGHGTMVAGILGAIGNNKNGVAGLNWNAKIMPIKVDDASGLLSTANIAKGIVWAADHGAKVINMSLGSVSDSITLKSAIDYAYDKGCVLVAATGNDSRDSLAYPARYPNVIAAGATINGVSRYSTSNYGTGMDVVAGWGNYTTAATGGYSSAGGTSIASPQVSGLASLILAVNPNLTNDQVYDLIRQGAKPLGGGYNIETGYGLIDCGKTLQLAMETLNEPPQTPIYDSPPTLTLNGLADIQLEAGGTYTEPGYIAVDCLGVDITDQVVVTGLVDTETPGNYTLTYTVTDAGGNTVSDTRTVTVTAKQPVETKLPRVSYNFTGQGKAPITIIHTGVVADASGIMDLSITNISGKVSMTVKLINIVTGATVTLGTFSAKSSKQFYIDAGKYNVVVTIDSGNGTNNYKMTLTMPEAVGQSLMDAAA